MSPESDYTDDARPAGPPVPTLEQLKARWKSNREADLWEADEATW